MPITAGIPNHTLEHSEFLIEAIEEIGKEGKKHFSLPHRNAYYSIVWINKGEGSWMLDFESFKFTSGDVFFISPGQVHFITVSEAMQGLVISFSEGFFCVGESDRNFLNDASLFNKLNDKVHFKIKKKQEATFLDLADKIKTEYKKQALGRDEVIRAYLKIFLLQAARMIAFEKDYSGTPKNKFKEFRVALDKQITSTHGVAAYASMLSTSVKCLNDLTKEASGKTASQLVKERLLLESMRKLYNAAASIKEISFELGFEDPAYFSRFFKKSSGLSPQQFRESIVQKYK